MENKKKKIILPKKLQIQMLNFFIKTSVPRKMRKIDKSTIKNN